MLNQLLEVSLIMDIKAVPDVSEHDTASEAEFFDVFDAVKADASQCHDSPVNDFLFRESFEFCRGEGLGVLFFGNTAENGREEDIVARFFVCDNFFCRVTGDGEMSFVAGGRFGVAMIEVYSPKTIFLFQIEMVVHHNFLPMLLGNERQQAL